MEKLLCNIEILKNPDSFIARVQTDEGGLRELKSQTFEGILEQVILEIQDEFEMDI
jgi:hypothetical protein